MDSLNDQSCRTQEIRNGIDLLNKKKINPRPSRSDHWEHRVFRVVNSRYANDEWNMDIPGDRLEYMFLEDYDIEQEELGGQGWQHQLGFAADKHKIYLVYMRPNTIRKRI